MTSMSNPTCLIEHEIYVENAVWILHSLSTRECSSNERLCPRGRGYSDIFIHTQACNCSMFCCTLIYVHSSMAIILMGKRELIALLNLSSWCLVMVERLFLAVPQGCLQFVIVVFPDHTHLLFLGHFLGSEF